MAQDAALLMWWCCSLQLKLLLCQAANQLDLLWIDDEGSRSRLTDSTCIVVMLLSPLLSVQVAGGIG
ncbi:hypothetical protein ACET1Q_23150 [Escherichia coli]|uniref:hypothetical protein n=1 Tax=Escherichia coli TaxID=562 RepID=UPI0035A70FAB